MPAPATARPREAVRAIVITPERNLLLVNALNPLTQERFWIVPGGGIEAGESHHEALRRELWEEVRLADYEVGPVLWRRHHTFDVPAGRLSQRETLYAVHAARFDAAFHDEHEMLAVSGLRWWSLTEIARTKDRVTPPNLAALVTRYLDHGPPDALPDWEVIVD